MLRLLSLALQPQMLHSRRTILLTAVLAAILPPGAATPELDALHSLKGAHLTIVSMFDPSFEADGE